MNATRRLYESKVVRILLAIVLAIGLVPTVTLAQSEEAHAAGFNGITCYTISDPDGFQWLTNGNATYQTQDGSVVYCLDWYAWGPDRTGTFFNGSHLGDHATDYIMACGYPSTTRINGVDWSIYEARAITQVACWLYRTPGIDIQAADRANGYQVTPTYIIDNGRTLLNNALAYQGGDSNIDGRSIIYTTDQWNYEHGEPYQDMIGVNPNPYGWLELDKDSADTDITDGNPGYSLAGCHYGIYSSWDDANSRVNAVQTLVTNGDGWARSGDLTPGTYYVRESNAEGEHGSGYAVDETIYEVPVPAGDTAYVNGGKVYDQPMYDPAGIWVGKIDLETTLDMPQGSASLADAQFTVRYYAGQFSSVEEAEASDDDPPTWVIRTNENGYTDIQYGDETFQTKDGQTLPYLVSGDEFFYAPSGEISFPLGTILVQETKAPEGYELPDPAPVYIQHITEEGVDGEVDQYNAPTVPEEVIRGGVSIQKIDAETGDNSAQGAATVDGAAFRIYNRSDNAVMVDGKSYEPGQPIMTITTVDGVASTRTDALPYGHYSIEEVVGPDGYLVTSRVLEFDIVNDGEMVKLHGDEGMQNTVKRGDIEFQKKDASTGTAMAGIPFRITSETTGESHVIVTDENGYASTSADWNAHSYRTNYNDSAADGAYDSSAGIWFGISADGTEAPVQDDAGALPYDTYTIEELPCAANEGLQLVVQTGVIITRDGYTVELGTIDDLEAGLGTTAMDASDGDHVISAGADATLIDKVSYTGLIPGNEFTLRSEILDPSTGELLEIGGKTFASETSFIPENGNGSVEIRFDLSSTLGLLPSDGFEITGVVAESLYDASGRLVAEHRDTTDSGQTFKIVPPSTGTEASDGIDGDRTVSADPDSIIHDQVSYTRLTGGAEYRLLSAAVPRESAGDASPDDLSMAIGTSDIVFESGDLGMGTVGADVYCDTSGLEDGQAIVMMAWIYDAEGNLVARHADPNAVSQTVTVKTPAISTAASDPSDGDQILIDDGSREVTARDAVSYANLVPNRTYRLVTTVMDAQTGHAITGEDGKAVSSTTEFTPALSAGTVGTSLTFDPSDIPTGGRVVLFESLYRDDVLIATHADLADQAQTLSVERPVIWTAASDPSDGDQTVTLDPEASVHDQVSIQNVIDGKDYRLIGILMDAQTGLPYVQGDASADEVEDWWNDMLDALGSGDMPRTIDLERARTLLSEGVGKQVVTSSADFSLPDSWGQIGTDFGPFDATNLQAGSRLVVFQALINIDGSAMVASHADLADEGQTVSFMAPRLDSVAVDASDGDKAIAEDPESAIIETLSISDAVPDAEYRVVAQAYLIEDGQSEPSAYGDPVEQTFSLPDTWGEAEIRIPVDSSALAGKKIVITDELYRGDSLIAVHKVFSDADQTVDVYEPEIGTTASDGLDGDKNIVTDTVSTLKDVVHMDGLIVGKTYQLTGVLMVKSTGEPLKDSEGSIITSNVEFTAEHTSEDVEMTFVFDSTLLDGEQVVAFETLYRNGIEIAAHADLEDEGQTVDVTNPELDSVAVDGLDGDKSVVEEPESSVVETLTVTNAVPGVEYRVEAQLSVIDDEGSAAAIGDPVEQAFTLDHDHGEVQITLPVDSSALAGKKVVVTDKLYRGDALISVHDSLDDADQTVDVFEPEIGTTASDGLDGDKNIVTDTVSTLKDVVSYSDLVVGKPYTLTGTVMVKSTGEPLLDAEGNPVSSTIEFTPQTPAGEVEMTFTFDSRLLDGEQVVAFETLYRNGIEIAAHADLEDEGQTVDVTNPELDSVAVDTVDGDKALAEDPEASVTETLTVTNAVPGSEYVARAQLYLVGEDGSSEILGDPVEKAFTLDHDHGEIVIEVPCDVSTLSGKKVVMTDELYRDGVLISEHMDLGDADQTVDVYEPEIGTTASDGLDGDSTAVIDPETTLVDVVEYNGLVPGKTYTLTLVPHVKSSGEALTNPETGEPYSATIEFTPDKKDGSVEVSITVDTTALSGDAVVAFETLYRNGIEITAHADIDDEGQTVDVIQPVVDTVAVDGLDGDKNIVADPEAQVVDTLSYENAIPEAVYTSHGILMDAETGLPLLSGEGADEIADEDLQAFWDEFIALLNIHQPAVEPDVPLDGGEGIEGEPPDGFAEEGAVEDAVPDEVIGGSSVAGIFDLFAQLMSEDEGDAASEEAAEEAQAEMPFAASMADWEGIYKLFADNPAIASCISTSEVEFTADRSYGEIEAAFDLDTMDIAGKQAVVFQLLTKEDSLGRVWTVALHDDLADADQTVDIVPSEIGTEATDKTDGDHTILNSSEATIVDTVTYRNLIPGKSYTLSGKIMNKATGEVLIAGDKEVVAEASFVPNQPDGTVDLEFTFDASAITAGTELVAFESLTKDGIEVAVHADLEDAAQTVTVEEPPVGGTYDQTGRNIALIAAALAAFAAIGGGAAAYGIHRRRKSGGEKDAA